MKHILLLIAVFILTNLPGFSQDELPFRNSRWTYDYEHYGELGFQFLFVNGDTIIDDVTRSKLHITTDRMTESYLLGFLHEQDKKIYFRYDYRIEDYPISGFWGLHFEPDTDYAIYDFSLQKGDEFSLELSFGDSQQRYIQEVDSVEMGGEKRKRYTVKEEPDDFYTEFWIEGMGSSEGLFYFGLEVFTTCMDCRKSFVCYSENNEALYLNPQYNECPEFSYASVDTPDKSTVTRVHPNPMTDKTVFTSVFPITELLITDLSGRTIRQIPCYGETEFTLFRQSLPSGIYLVNVNLQNGDKEMQKLIVK